MDLFANLKSFFKINTTTIDNNIFRLHYKFTTVILVVFSILVTARQYIGDPIDCIADAKIPNNMLDTFCWVHGTFSVPDSWRKIVGEEIPYPGVGSSANNIPRVYHSYYQWVCFVLFLQAIMFYVPRYFWKAAERGRIKCLTLGLNSPILAGEEKEKNRKLLVECLASNLNQHRMYFVNYAIAEVLNFVNVIGQIYLVDVFLGKEFSTYGVSVLQFSNWDGSVRYDPMIRVFPRVTKCIFYKFGNGGGMDKADALCILPINIINEKIYIFLWFWFIILAVLTGLVLVYRYLTIFSTKCRFMVTSTRARLVDPRSLSVVINKCNMGDWFILDLLSKNLDPLNFRDVINDLASRLGEKNFVHMHSDEHHL